MENTYTWDITGIQAYPSHGGKYDVVVAIHWVLTGTDGISSASRQGAAGIAFNPNSEFTPYENLTKEELIAWVQESLGLEGVQEAMDGVSSDLIQLSKRPILMNLPWI